MVAMSPAATSRIMPATLWASSSGMPELIYSIGAELEQSQAESGARKLLPVIAQQIDGRRQHGLELAHVDRARRMGEDPGDAAVDQAVGLVEHG